MVTTKLNLSMTEPQVRQIYAKQGDTGRVLDISLDQTPEDGTLRILRPDGTEVTSEAVTGGEVESGGTFESLTEADVTELTVGIEPVQDLNGYDAPWVGGAGKNLVDNSALTKGFYNDSGTFLPNGSGEFYTTPLIPVQSGATYTASFYSGGLRIAGLVMTQWDANGNVIRQDTSTSVTMASNTTHVRLRNFASQGSVMQSEGTSARWQLELGSSFTSWQPYSNICPITGHDEVTVTRTGKNLYAESPNFAGYTNSTRWALQSETYDGNPVMKSMSAYYGLYKNVYLDVGTYTFSCMVKTSDSSRVAIYSISNNVDGHAIVDTTTKYTGTSTSWTKISITFSVTTAGYASCRAERPSSGDIYVSEYQIEQGSTATAYEPYQGSTYTTSLGQTVYGGTLDMVTGQLVVNYKKIDLGNYNYGKSSDNNFYISTVTDFKVYGTGTTRYGLALCDSFAFLTGNWTPHNSTCTCYYNAGYNGYRIFFHSEEHANDSTAEFKAYMQSIGASFVYELATPLTYTLTPQQIKTLVGTNNVWASSGDIVSIKFSYGGLLSELPSEATEIVGKCYCDVEQNGVSSMPFTLNVKKNERES